MSNTDTDPIPEFTRGDLNAYLDDFERTNTLDGQHIDRDAAWDAAREFTAADLAATRAEAEREFGFTGLTDAQAAGLRLGMSEGPWWADDTEDPR